MRNRLIIVISVFLAGPVLAEESPDNMIARGHYTRGATAYEERRYEVALHEFEAAHAADPLPALDYNIARCLDRLNRKAEALAAYERYLQVMPVSADNQETRERVARLRHELVEASPVMTVPTPTLVLQASPRPSQRRWIVPGAVGGGALLFAVVGSSLLGSAAASYHSLSSTCSPGCSSESWAALPAREHAGEVLLGIAAAALVVDVALIVRAARGK